MGRRHPPRSARHQLDPFTSSFPSGHAAADLAFVLGAAQELSAAFVPLSSASLAVHWALVRKRAHYPSDVIAGGILAIPVTLIVRKLWPPAGRKTDVVPVRSSEEPVGSAQDPLGSEPSGNGAGAPAALGVVQGTA